MTERNYFVHESSYVDEPCQIGEGTKIWHFSHIQAGAVIGKNCSIGQNVNIGGKVRLGNRVKVQNNVSIYDMVELQDEVFCGPSMVFTNVFNPRAFIERKHEFRKTLVKRGATIGANATLLCGITIGRYAFIGAGAVITRDVSDYALMYGNPAVRRGWVCRCAVKLNFVGSGAVCSACGSRYELKGDVCRPIEAESR